MKVFYLSLLGQSLFALLTLLGIFIVGEQGGRFRRIGSYFVLGELGLFFLLYFSRDCLTYSQKSIMLHVFNNYYVGLMLFLFLFFSSLFLLWVAIRFTPLRRYASSFCIRKRWYRYLFLALVPTTVLLCWKGYCNTMYPRMVHHRIDIPKECGVDSLRVAFVTDIHIGEIITPHQLQKLVTMVREANPDYVLVGGDMIDYYTHYAFRPDVENLLKSMHSDKSRIVYVLGNHEYYYHPGEKERWFDSLGVLLKDSVLRLSDNLYLIGRDDATNTSRSSLSSLLEKVPLSAVKIVLDHQPSEMDIEKAAKIDLALHGHTHNGQLIPFKWLVALRFGKSYGSFRRGGTCYYISSGFGVAGSPFRVGTHSEIAILDLHFKSKSL